MSSTKTAQFNDSQIRAINHFTGPALILAGPGSGKTLVIIHRIKSLIEKHKIPPENILVVTFSKAAAGEMKNRYEKITPNNRVGPAFGTFHSIFFKILRAAYGYDSSNIILENQKYEILKYEIEKYNLEYDNESDLIKKTINEISRVKNSLIPLDKFVSSLLPSDIFRKIFNSYNHSLLTRKLIDFDDMLSMTYELLKSRPDILEIWQNMYNFILVDEFQDINRIQYETIKLLTGKSRNLFVVGDDDQSIYGFRGSKPRIMFNFQRDFPDALNILLNINYRSKKLILSKSQKLISVNQDRMAKNVKAFKDNSQDSEGFKLSSGEVFSIRSFDSQEEQYETITDEIYHMQKAGYNLSEIAVLFRNNFDSSVLAERLSRRNIPFTVRDNPKNIFRHFIASDLMAYIRLGLESAGNTGSLPGPGIRSDLLRIINKPLRYISRAALDNESLKCSSGCCASFLKQTSAYPSWQSMPEAVCTGSVPAFRIEKYFTAMKNYYSAKPHMLTQIKMLESHLKYMGSLAPFAAIEYVRKAVGYEDYIKMYAKEKHVDIEELISTMDAIQESAGTFTTFSQWTDYIEKYTDELSEISKSNTDKSINSPGVQLMTMHSSKGLEFDTVYIPNVNHENIPIRRAVSKEEVSEERRLLYVAMTRARDHLKISYVNHIRNRKIAPSEFLESIL